MNQEIEQRIVAMYFDNKDFEKNAKETIETLGELRDNLNLEDSVKGFEELDKAGKKLNLNNVKSNINNMKSSLSGFQNVLNKAFSIGTAPVRALENFFGTFQSYVGKFVGFDLASKFVNSLENALRQLTVAPIEAGWSMYESTIDSVKTIMSGTLQTYSKAMSEASDDWVYDEEEHMKYVKGQLNELSRYAQQTVFSLSDMTNNIGKFTNNAVSLEDAVPAMEGIANMTAKAGQGAQQASMAMYNFSQAIGVGKMTTVDWKSIENANIATTELKDAFIKTAVAGGQLHKEVTKLANGEEVVKYFKTVDKNGKKLAKNKWVEVSAQNFRDTLSEGWLDRDTMLKVMKVYSGTIKNKQELYDMGFDMEDEELIDYLMKIGEEAAAAATQVRTFSKMWDALTEAVQSGWADSMQLIFGDMFEATEFWTKINDEISEVLDKSANERNKMLHEWRGEVYNSEKEIWEKQEGAYDGRKDLVQGIYNLITAAKALGSTFSNAWHEVFGKMDGSKLQDITRKFRELTEQFDQWLNGKKFNGESRLEKIQKGLRGVFSIFKAVGNAVKSVFGVILKLAAPVTDVFINLFSGVVGFFDGIGDMNFKEIIDKVSEGVQLLWKEIVGFFSPTETRKYIGSQLETVKGDSPFMRLIKSTFGSAGAAIKAWMSDNGLGGVLKALEDAWAWIVEVWNKITAWEGWAAIGAFFTNIFVAIRDYFAPKSKAYDDRGFKLNQDSQFIRDVKKVWNKIKTVWDTVSKWPAWSAIGQFASNVWTWITMTFGAAWKWFTEPKESGNTGFVDWLNSIWSDITSAWDTITAKAEEYAPGIRGFLDNAWEWIQKTTTAVWEGFTKPDENGETEFSKWIQSVWDKIVEVWNGIKNVAKPVADEVWGFLTNTWEWIKEKAGFGTKKVMDFPTPFDTFGKGNEGVLNQTKAVKDAINQAKADNATEGKNQSFLDWLNGVWKGIEDTWDDIKKAAEPVFKAISEFVTNTFEWASTTFGLAWDWVTKPGDDGKTGFSKWLDNVAAELERAWASVRDWPGWTTIGTFFENMWNGIVGLFGDGTAEEQKSEESVEGIVASAVSTIGTLAGAGASKVTESNVGKAEARVGLFERIFNAISDFIKIVGENLTGTDLGPVSKFFESVGVFFTGLLDIVNAVLDAAGRLMSGLASGGISGGWNALTENEKWMAGITVAITLVSKLLSMLTSRWESKLGNTESFAKKLYEFGAAALMLAAALGIISIIPEDKLWKGAAVLAVLLVVISVIATKVSEAAQANETNATERVLTKLINAVEKVALVAVAMALLPEIIKAIAEAKKIAPDFSGTDVMTTLIGLATALGIMILAFAGMDKILGQSKTGDFKTSATLMGKFLMWFLVILGVVAGLGIAANKLNGTKTLLEGLKDAKEVLTAFGEAVGGLIGGLLGGFFEPIRKAFGIQTDEEKFDSAMTMLQDLAGRLDYFTPEKLTGINRIISSIGMLSETVDKVPNGQKLATFAEWLAPLGHAIIDMGVALAGFTEQDPGIQGLSLPDVEANIMKVAEIIRAFQPLASFDSIATKSPGEQFVKSIHALTEGMTDEDFNALADWSAKFVEAFNKITAPDSEAMVHSAGDLLANLSSAIRIGMGDNVFVGMFDAEPIIDAIVLAISGGETRVATAVHDMIQLAIDNAGSAKTLGTEGASGFSVDWASILGMVTDSTSEIESGLTGSLTNPLGGLLSGETASLLSDSVFGVGGSKDNPTDDSLFGIMNFISDYQFDDSQIPDIGSKIQEKMKIKDANGEDMDLAAFIQQNLDSMNTALQEAGAEFEITIIPTIDWSNLTQESIRNQLLNMPINYRLNQSAPDKAIRVDYTGLYAELGLGLIRDELGSIENAIDAERLQVVQAIDNMGTRIDNVSTSIRALKLYLDTGALVGGITPYVDLALGRRARLAERLGV